jgi:RNA polymerase sigma factor (sigma-70 family)
VAATDIDRAEVEEKVRAAAQGSQEAFDWLIHCYTGLVWSVIRAHGLSDADASDVFQTTWLRLVEHLDRLRDPRAIGGWLATTSRHESLRLLRLADRHRPTPDETFERVEDPGEGVDAVVLDDDRNVHLWAALEELGERCRSLLRVLMADPMPSYEEVSVALGMPVGSIGPTRARCLHQLRDRLRTRGISG